MTTLSAVVLRLLNAQIDAGAQAVQLFDSWVGQLSPDDYATYVAPHVRGILQPLMTRGVPVLHFGTGTATLLEAQRDAGGTVIGVDWRTPLDDAWRRLGDGVAVQGNLDPTLLLAPRDVLLAAAGRVLDRAANRNGHVFNLGHGILPETPVDNVAAVVDFVHQRSER